MSVTLEKARIVSQKYRGILTQKEFKILELYTKKSVKKMVLDSVDEAYRYNVGKKPKDHIKPLTDKIVYDVFRRIRDRMIMFRSGVALFNDLAKMSRFRFVLSSRKPPYYPEIRVVVEDLE